MATTFRTAAEYLTKILYLFGFEIKYMCFENNVKVQIIAEK